MAVTINLEKNGKMKNAFTGFSWITFFFGFWVPIFRGDFKQFLKLFLLFLVRVFLIFSSVRAVYIGENGYMNIFLKVVNLVALYTDIWIAFSYNKKYTLNLFKKGYQVMNGDRFSLAVLKNYAYLPYTEAERENLELMDQYEKTAKAIRKDERNKAKIFFGIFIISEIISFIFSLISQLH